MPDHEERWTDEIEVLLKEWKTKTEKLSDLHDQAGYIVKSRYYIITIPSIIIPLVVGFVTQVIPEADLDDCNKPVTERINSAVLMFSGILNGLMALFDYSGLYEKHFQTSARYNDITNRIESELARKKKYRVPPDVFTTEMKCQIDNVNDSGPEMPLGCSCC